MATWSSDFFGVGANGNLWASPKGQSGGVHEAPASVDLFELTRTIERRGIATPVLVRFPGILQARLEQLNAAFNHARAEYEYSAPYRGVFPIKVNQERWVVEALLEGGRKHKTGLEVGSKPELIAGIALQASEGSLLICNGYKDSEYVEMALLSTRLGIETIIVIEKITELDLVLKAARTLRIRPRIGVRCKLSSASSGRWASSTGTRSKFGLTASEIVCLVETLRAGQALDCLELLHIHIGSQITHIRSVKHAMGEATQVLANLHALGAEVKWFDAGGGLAVDYDGSRSGSDSSMNYSMQEYANDIVWSLAEACREHGMNQPTIVTESGRSLVAHHSVLITEVVGTTGLRGPRPLLETQKGHHDLLADFASLGEGVNTSNAVERYHDAHELRERALLLFNTGQLSLRDKGIAEQLFTHTCQAVQHAARSLSPLPEALNQLERDLCATYFLNASFFQSLPDSWAIDHLFPIMPLQRLDEQPTQGAILADLTCDSDGRVDQFIGPSGPKDVLELHPPRADEPYYVGVFLLGAYQEILGDIHNLFGDTHVVHVDIDAQGRPHLLHVQTGDRITDVLSYVKYDESELRRKIRRHVESSLRQGQLSDEECARFLDRYEACLRGYTYLRRHSPYPSLTPSANSSAPTSP